MRIYFIKFKGKYKRKETKIKREKALKENMVGKSGAWTPPLGDDGPIMTRT